MLCYVMLCYVMIMIILLYRKSRKKFINTMKWNVSLTVITTASTVVAMFLIAVYSPYWWLYTLDYSINGFACYFMVGANRKLFVEKILCLTFGPATNILSPTGMHNDAYVIPYNRNHHHDHHHDHHHNHHNHHNHNRKHNEKRSHYNYNSTPNRHELQESHTSPNYTLEMTDKNMNMNPQIEFEMVASDDEERTVKTSTGTGAQARAPATLNVQHIQLKQESVPSSTAGTTVASGMTNTIGYSVSMATNKDNVVYDTANGKQVASFLKVTDLTLKDTSDTESVTEL